MIQCCGYARVTPMLTQRHVKTRLFHCKKTQQIVGRRTIVTKLSAVRRAVADAHETVPTVGAPAVRALRVGAGQRLGLAPSLDSDDRLIAGEIRQVLDVAVVETQAPDASDEVLRIARPEMPRQSGRIVHGTDVQECAWRPCIVSSHQSIEAINVKHSLELKGSCHLRRTLTTTQLPNVHHMGIKTSVIYLTHTSTVIKCKCKCIFIITCKKSRMNLIFFLYALHFFFFFK